MTQVLTYKYRLLPTKKQHAALASILEDQRQLYNAALQERIDCYRKTGKGLSCFDQIKSLTVCRKDVDGMGGIPLNLQRWTIRRLDEAYRAFFRRLKSRNGRAGFPRFRGYGRFNSFGFAEFSGIRLLNNRLHFKGLPGSLRIHFHRPLPEGKICSAQFTRDDKGWSVCLQIKTEAPEKKAVETSVGIDLGLKTFAYQSDGVILPNPRIARKAEKELRRRQRQLARCKRGSNRRKKVKAKVAKLHAKILNTRNTWLHQQSARIVNQYDLIAVEDLQVKNMVRNPHLARSISDASWSKFTEMLSYKAEKAGKHIIKVNPKNTSKQCSRCKEMVPKTLATRTHKCGHCGLEMDRDENAALNILHAVVVDRRGHNVGGYAKRGTGNIMEMLSK